MAMTRLFIEVGRQVLGIFLPICDSSAPGYLDRIFGPSVSGKVAVFASRARDSNWSNRCNCRACIDGCLRIARSVQWRLL